MQSTRKISKFGFHSFRFLIGASVAVTAVAVCLFFLLHGGMVRSAAPGNGRQAAAGVSSAPTAPRQVATSPTATRVPRAKINPRARKTAKTALKVASVAPSKAPAGAAVQIIAKNKVNLNAPGQAGNSQVTKTGGTKDQFVLGPDTGNGGNGESGDDAKKRANYFYAQRAYPNDQTPPGARQRSLDQLDSMITQQRALGILPPEGAAPDSLSVGFPGPANWTNLGPQPVTNSAGGVNFGNPASTGRVTAIAVDPTTPSTVYLGAATGGVWKSTDSGATWNTIFDQNNSLAIGGIGIAPSASSTIYVGTGELNFSGDSYYGAGIYKTTNGGTTWTQQCGPSGNFCNPVGSFGFQGGGFMVGDVAVNPTSPSIALAAVRDSGNGTQSGIYRTTDGGTTWALIPSASGAAGNSIVWNPSDNTIVYATLGQAGNSANFGVYKSTDSGATFTKLTGNGAPNNNLPTTNLGRHVLAVAPSNGSVIYVTINAASTSNLLGMAKSTDAGVTWTFTSPSGVSNSLTPIPDFCHGQCWYDMAIAVDPLDPNTVYLGGSAFTNNSSTDFRSSDGGTTWVDITTGSDAVRPHVDTHVLTFANNSGAIRLYTGNDGGIWFTDNPIATPVTWQPGNNANLTITQFYPGHAVNPSDENISFGGAQDNGTEKYSGILAWDHVTCGDGAWAAIDPIIPSTVYANCQNIAILKSTLDGVAGSWSVITNEIPTSGERSLFIPPLVQDQNRSGWLYFGTFRVWQSQTYGNDWIPISPDLTVGGDVTSVSVAQNNSNVVYATTSDGRVGRTTNANLGASATWTNLTKAPLPNRYATMVRTDPSNPDIAYLSYSGFNGFGGDTVGHIFKTTDGGTTWTDISGVAAGALPNSPVNDIAVVSISSLGFNAVFIGTDVGVFECSDPTAATPCQTWTPVGSGLPKVPVVGLAYRENSATLRAITHGRGVWVIETPGISASGLLLLTSITPSSRTSGSGAFTMTFDGNDFGAPSGTPQILFDGADPGVTNITLANSNHMTATIPASVTANPGWHQITINQPGHASLPSNPTCCISFGVTGPPPTLTLISPTQANTGSASFPLTLTGTGFICGATPAASLVQFGQTQLNPSTCSSTSMTATVPSNLLTTPGSVNVKAFNPGPGGGNSGAQSFTIGTPATNDNFANAMVITTLPFTDTELTGAATTEVGEPVPSAACLRAFFAGGAPSHSIWYSYTPGASGVVSFNSPGNTLSGGLIQVVTGTALGGLTTVPGGCELDLKSIGLGGEAATVKVTAGVTYHIMLSDAAGAGGTQVMHAVAVAPPANDDFAGAMNITTVPFANTQTTTGATTETGEPVPACTGQQATSAHSVWYAYTPGSSGSAVFNTNGSSTDSIIQVVTGSLGGFAAVPNGCADLNGIGVGETVTVSVTSGTTYFIIVTDWVGTGGTSVLNLASGPAPLTTAPDLTILKTHTGNFTQGQVGATYSITATNSGAAATTGTVTVVDTLPASLNATALTGTGWACTLATLTCTRSDALSASSSYPAITLTVTVANNAPASVTNTAVVSGGGETNTANDTANDPTTITLVADLTINKSHVGNFTQGQVGATYTISVGNSGAGPTAGTVTVVDTLPASGLAATAINGTGWGCTLATLTCTRSDALAAAGTYPSITLTVTVANNAPASVTNSAAVSGGGELNTANDTSNDPTTIVQLADLTINKSHSGNFTQGQTGATYTITVTNSGTGSTSGTVTVVDTVPTPNLTATAIAGTGWACTLATTTCTRSDVLAPAGSYPTITVTVNVAANAPSSVTNTATVSGGGEANTSNDTSNDPTTITPTVQDLTVSKTHTGNFTQGQVGATYSITVSNIGGSPTSGTVTVVDTVPVGLTATALSGSGWACTLGTLTCTRSDVLAAGGSYPAITLTVNVANNAAASVTNSAAVSGGGETNVANDTSNDPTTIIQVADMTILKSHTGNFRQGQAGATYTITATNSGPGPTSGTVTVVDTLPANLTATAISGTGWACTLATLTCTRSDVLAAAGSYPAITLTVTVASNAPESVTNTATISGGGEINTGNDSSNDLTNIDLVADMTILGSHTGNFNQGQIGATYSLTATNSGVGPTVGTVTVVDTLPSGLTATAIGGTGWACTLATLTCTRSDVLAASGSYQAITVTVNVANNAAASVTNTANVSGGGEINVANDSSIDPTTVILASDMTISKTHLGNFTQGQSGATYTITVSNAGGGASSGAVNVSDTLPTGLIAASISGTGWACTLGTVSCTRSDSLASGGSYPAITLTVNVANNAAASVTNSAAVSGGSELNTANDSSSDPTTIIQVADLTVSKSHVGNFTQGQVGATYSITVNNVGPGPTSGTTTVVDTLPAGLTATGLSGTGWACTVGTLTCTRSDVLANGAGYPVITLAVTVASNAAASITNTATVSGGGELNAANDVANDPTTVTPAFPDMTISKSHAGNFNLNQVGATYTIVATNSGTIATDGSVVTVVDTLPAGLTATNIAGTGWACTLATLTCTRSDVLAIAASYPAITLTVNVAANAATSVTNSAAVSGGGEVNVANDSATDPTTITRPDLTITKTHTGNFNLNQVGATYTITVTNSGNGATSGTVTVVDTLPTGLTATSIAGTGWACTLGTLTCTRSDFLAAAGAYPAITLTVNVAANASASVTNNVAVSGGGEINVANDSATDPTTVTAPDMTITKTHVGNFAQGQVGATYTITATNSGNGATSGTVTVVDTLPGSLTATAMAGTGWACTLATLTCTRSDVLANAASYPAITLTVTVSPSAPASVTNNVTVSGGGEINVANDSANNPTTVTTATAAFSTGALVFTAQDVTVPSAAKPITITNNGTGALNFSVAPGFSGTNAGDFSAGAGTTCVVGTPVAPAGGTCVFNAVFTPGAAGARGQATLTFTDNASPTTTQTVTLNGTGIDFAPTGPGAPVTVAAGSPASFTITVTPGTGGFPNPVTFSATGAPAATTVTFNPTSVTPNGTAASTAMMVTTTMRTGVLPSPNGRQPSQSPYPFVLLWTLAGAMLLFMLVKMRKTGRRGRMTPALYGAVVLMAAVGIVGCTHTPTGTPAGTSTITVTATSGSLSHTTTVTLTVQ